MDPHTCSLLSLQLGDETKQFVIDVSTINILEYKPLLESKTLIFHNAKFDLKFLFYYKIVPTKIYDTFLVERILTTGIDTVRRSLDAVVQRYCSVELDKSVRSHIQKEGLSARVIKYAADDVKYLHQVKDKQEIALQANELNRTASLDNEFVITLAYIEFCGFYLNAKQWQKKCEEDKKDLQVVKERLDDFILTNSEEYRHLIDNQLSLFDEGVFELLSGLFTHTL